MIKGCPGGSRSPPSSPRGILKAKQEFMGRRKGQGGKAWGGTHPRKVEWLKQASEMPLGLSIGRSHKPKHLLGLLGNESG